MQKKVSHIYQIQNIKPDKNRPAHFRLLENKLYVIKLFTVHPHIVRFTLSFLSCQHRIFDAHFSTNLKNNPFLFLFNHFVWPVSLPLIFAYKFNLPQLFQCLYACLFPHFVFCFYNFFLTKIHQYIWGFLYICTNHREGSFCFLFTKL